MQAWIELLLLATHRRNLFYVRGIPIELLSGEIAYAQGTLAERWKWDIKTVKKFLITLQSKMMIEIKTDNVITKIRILS